MKHIVKGAPPTPFEAWKAQADHLWQPTYASLQNPEKRALHQQLLAEQGEVCCYCGIAIGIESSHIEHFRPQESYEVLALDHANLFASCIRERKPGAPLHCGHAKGNAFDEQLAIPPTDAGCETRFLYSMNDGAVYPAARSDEPASYMIGLLKLDIDFLRNRRKEALSAVFDDAFVSTASNEELVRLGQEFQERDVSGRLPNFGHVLARYAAQILEERTRTPGA